MRPWRFPARRRRGFLRPDARCRSRCPSMARAGAGLRHRTAVDDSWKDRVPHLAGGRHPEAAPRGADAHQGRKVPAAPSSEQQAGTMVRFGGVIPPPTPPPGERRSFRRPPWQDERLSPHRPCAFGPVHAAPPAPDGPRPARPSRTLHRLRLLTHPFHVPPGRHHVVGGGEATGPDISVSEMCFPDRELRIAPERRRVCVLEGASILALSLQKSWRPSPRCVNLEG